MDLGELVQKFRKRKQLSLLELGGRVGCSAPTLWKLENGKRKNPIPLDRLRRLSKELTRDHAEEQELFHLAGYEVPAPDNVQRIVRIVEETLQLPEFSELAKELISGVESYVANWRTMRSTWRQNIRKVVIAAAGWQPRLLAMKVFEETLLPLVDEAARANIREVLLVVPPNTPDLDLLTETFPDSTITQVVQPNPVGLGNALLATKEHIVSEPFCLILADEIDESRTALRDLVKAYDQVRKPLVAVDNLEPKGSEAVLRNYGFAPLGEQVRRPHLFALEGELLEKPDTRPAKHFRRIAGRYVLTPEIVRELESLQYVEKRPVKHDLTVAINQFWLASASVLAYELSGCMLSIAPYKYVMQQMDRREVFNSETYRKHAAARRGQQRS